MQEIRRFTWCDVCVTESPDDAPAYEPAETHTVTVDAAKPMAIDLCDRHHKALVTPLVELLAAHGYRDDMAPPVKTGRPGNANQGKGANSQPCLWCDIAFSSTSGLAGHLHRAHGFPAREDGRANISAIYGVARACPYCARPMSPTAAPQNLGIHMARGHVGEPTTLAASFKRAREMGDPHGIVAKVMAQVGPDGQYVAPRRKR